MQFGELSCEYLLCQTCGGINIHSEGGRRGQRVRLAQLSACAFLSHMGCSMQPDSDHQGKLNNTEVIFWYSSYYFFFFFFSSLVLFQAAFGTLNLCLYIIGVR